MNEDFFSTFFKQTIPTGFAIFNIDENSLNKFRKVAEEVKKKLTGSQIKIEYDVIKKELHVYGNLVDIYWFGYFTKQFE